MPLSSRINKSEPKKKKAKVTKQKSTTSIASNGGTTANGNASSIADSTTNTTFSTENDDSVVNTSTAAAVPAPTTTRASAAAAAAAATTNGKSNKKVEQNGEAATNGTDKTNDEVKSSKTTVKTPSKNKKQNGNNSVSTNVNTSTAAAFTSINEETMMTDTSNQTATEQASTITVSGGANKNVEPIKPIVRNFKPGNVLSVGENLSNQLGLGAEVDDRKKPQLVKDLPKNVIQIAAGGMHSACLTEDGIVYTFGCNDEFALGRDNDDEIDKVELPEKCIEITAGDSHTAALSESGVVYAWGTFRDGSGVLGLEQKKIAKTPMKFKLRDKVLKISSGADHLVFLTVNGEVYTAGNSEHGQLGRVSKYNSCRGGRRGCDMILVPGLVRFGKRKELQGHKQIEDIWTSAYCTFLQVKDSDLIIGFGLNNCFQLGLDDAENRYQPDILQTLKFESKLKKVIGGMHHTLFLDTNGRVYALGSHRYGGLGVGKIEADVKSPVRVDSITDIIDIAANTNVSYAIDKAGKVYSWGTNYSKQLGQDTEDDYFVPTPVVSKQLDKRHVFSVSVGGQHSLFTTSEEKMTVE